MKSILGKKLVMTQVFRNDGTVVPVTRVVAGPCVVVQVKSSEKDNSTAVQVGFGTQKNFRLNKAQSGHVKDLPFTPRHLMDVPVGTEHSLKRGDVFTVTNFEVGDKVNVIGTSKGRGFQGVVKRHGFGGSPATHGHKDQLRMPGSIGATDPGRVFKGTRMAGHMGDQQVTVENLEIVEVHPEQNEIWIKGAIPGARNSLVTITCESGMLTATQSSAPQTEENIQTQEITNDEAANEQTSAESEMKQ